MINESAAQDDTLQARFWKKVHKTETCWNWIGHITVKGYGSFDCAIKRRARAHRVSYLINVGPIPTGLNVLHSCDNPACVRPGHLFVGTQTDNHRDMIAKKRYSRGERHPSSKLTTKQVLAIRADKRSDSIIAREYGMGTTIIGKIKNRTKWRHVP